MIDYVTIFTKGGIVLWNYSFVRMKGNPINDLISDVFLQGKTGSNSFMKDDYTLKWHTDNELQLTFVIIYNKIIRLGYVDALLEEFSKTFVSQHAIESPKDLEDIKVTSSFSDVFKSLLKSSEMKELQSKQRQKERAPRRFEQTAKFKQTKKGQQAKEKEQGDNESGFDGDISSSAVSPRAKDANFFENTPILESPSNFDRGDVTSPDVSSADTRQERMQKNLDRLKARGGPHGRGHRKKKNTPLFPPLDQPLPETSAKKKEKRVWQTGKISKDQAKALDFSKKDAEEEGENGTANLAKQKEFFLGNGELDLDGSVADSDGEEGYEASSSSEQDTGGEAGPRDSAKASSSKGGGLFSLFDGIVGNRELTRKDLEPILLKFRDHLTGKNVAVEIAEKLCDSVITNLEGKKLATFSTAKSTVKSALEASLVRILTPKRQVDILREVYASQKANKPYSIVFVGVNGVGKSTSLAKVAFFLRQNGFSVMIAACDTFRSGAVEQLRVHSKCLDVPLFEKGYGKDAAALAQQAIREASTKKIDVVLVDTAGRMQDNEPLMRALTKLVSVNNPDLVMFVGEALVGNEAVDQLVKFNQAMADNSTSADPRLLDGIMLTKYDTIDDKVGAALSMVYTTGQPIVFVGVGQTYTDLRRFNVKTVVSALLR